MNYLAHLLLSGDDPQWQLGGFLGDFIKGPLLPPPADQYGRAWTAEVLAGIRLHRRIDAYVDHHRYFKQALMRLGPSLRRCGGIALDLAFDHYLACRWHEFHPQDLHDYSGTVYTRLRAAAPLMPVAAQQFALRMAEVNLLVAYQEEHTLTRALLHTGRRLRNPEVMVAAQRQLALYRHELEHDFLLLMPELLVFVQAERQLITRQLTG